jgi:Ca-activated chloride channel family protein
MSRRSFPRSLVLLFSLAAVITPFSINKLLSITTASAQSDETNRDTPGALVIVDGEGKRKAMCPLRHTDVRAEISGFESRVNVTQEFENPSNEKIEAVYTFPLPANAAVDDMTMVVGERTVRGKILRREEAQAVYDAAKSGGQVASLLNQERPNIFTQSVANILPGEKVKITISYVDRLKYEDGAYEFSFPMVVGPRYIPGAGPNQVSDAARISPPMASPATRAGHDISIDIALDAGLPIDAIKGKSHEVELERLNAHTAHVRLKDKATIPNKDFILTYDVAGRNIQDAVLAHRSDKGGYFSLILQPPDRIPVTDVTPRELVFVLDTSGSMQGFPIEKAKETMNLALSGLNPGDTFNLITFAGDTRILFPAPVAATRANLRKAQAFLSQTSGYGGTEMMKAIQAALDGTDSQKHVRVVCFMTDGYVGNDMQIIAEVNKHPNARVFAFGIGSSVNRFLLDRMSDFGRGEVEYVALTDDGSAAARRFYERVRNPLLTDISIDWNGLPVADLYPQRIPDLFGAKPVIVTGRYTAGGQGVIRLRGKLAGQPFVREIAVNLPESETRNEVLAPLWACARVEDLMSQDYEGAQNHAQKPELKETIINLGLEYRLMTQYTSFVAVEEMIVTDNGQPRRIDVPVEVPEGVNPQQVQSPSAGGPTGLFANYSLQSNLGYIMNSNSTTTIVTKSGSNVGRAKGRDKRIGGGGPGGGGGGGTGSGSGAGGVAPSNNVSLDLADGFGKTLSPEEKRRQDLTSKLDPSILALVDRLKQQTAAAPGEAKFVRDGKADVQIWLNEKSAESLAQLKELGFEILFDSKSSKLVIGRLPIDKLEALAGLAAVRYVTPQTLR